MKLRHLFEPKRPQSYKELPHYDRLDYWYCMARTLRQLSDNLVEVPRFFDQRLRVVTLFLAVLVAGSAIVGTISSYGSLSKYRKEATRDFDYVFKFDSEVREQYKEFKAAVSTKRTEEEFVQGMKNLHSYRFVRRFLPHLIFPFFVLILLSIALFLPRGCPVRFDRKRQIAFTWHKGYFYVANTDPFHGVGTRLTSEADGSPIYGFDTRTGALGMQMKSSTNDTTRLFRIGIFPVCHAHQNRDLQMFIEAFMSQYLYSKDEQTGEIRRIKWNADWLKKIKRGRFFPCDPFRWFGSRTLGPKHNFDEANTKAMLKAYPSISIPDTIENSKEHVHFKETIDNQNPSVPKEDLTINSNIYYFILGLFAIHSVPMLIYLTQFKFNNTILKGALLGWIVIPTILTIFILGFKIKQLGKVFIFSILYALGAFVLFEYVLEHISRYSWQFFAPLCGTLLALFWSIFINYIKPRI